MERTENGNLIRETEDGNKYYYERRYIYDQVHFDAFSLSGQRIATGYYRVVNFETHKKMTINELTSKISKVVDRELSK